MRPLRTSKARTRSQVDIIAHLVRTKVGGGWSEGLRDLEIQLMARCANNRYRTPMAEGEILEAAEACIEKFRFLLESPPDPLRVKFLFLGALTDAITCGSGTHWLLKSSWNRRFKPLWRLRMTGSCRFEEGFGLALRPMRRIMDEKYPHIPGTRQCFTWRLGLRRRGSSAVHHPFGLQLLHTFAHPAHILLHRSKFNPDRFAKEFLRKNKWCLERLCRCDPIFRNKYTDEICREVSYDLGLDTDKSYFRWLPYLNEPIVIPRNDIFLRRIQNLIVDRFTEQELRLFEETDCDGQPWTLADQIRDRYRSKYPSFAPIGEVEDRIGAIIEDYRPLLNPETAEVVRELMLDEIEVVAFVSKATHRWNREMERNLQENQPTEIPKETLGAIDEIIRSLPEGLVEGLSDEVDGRIVGLRERLIARWSSALVGISLRRLRLHLDRLGHCTLRSSRHWGNSATDVELQALLGELDNFFLYPQKGRILKRLFGALDTGRTVRRSRGGSRLKLF